MIIFFRVPKTDNFGNFSLKKIIPGVYSLIIDCPGLTPITKEIEIGEGELINLNRLDLNILTPDIITDAINAERKKWDANNDNKIGILEAINALQGSSGIR